MRNAPSLRGILVKRHRNQLEPAVGAGIQQAERAFGGNLALEGYRAPTRKRPKGVVPARRETMDPTHKWQILKNNPSMIRLGGSTMRSIGQVPGRTV